MKNFIYTALFAILLSACQTTTKDSAIQNTTPIVNNEVAKAQINDEGYQLMKQNCFICHFEKMDPSKKDKMIAPPMRNIQEHYKPTYPNKEDFIEAIVKWANKPNEDDLKMPGATRKFGLMPALPIGDKKLTAIADALFDMDFGESRHGRGRGHGKGKRMHGQGKGRGNGGLYQEKTSLNNGKKWQLQKEDVARVNKIIGSLHGFESNDVTEYRQMGKWIFEQAKKMMLNKSYDEAAITQLHNFFYKVEEDMHKLMAVENASEGEKYKLLLQKEFDTFSKYFQ